MESLVEVDDEMLFQSRNEIHVAWRRFLSLGFCAVR